jgi:hypothetical protein
MVNYLFSRVCHLKISDFGLLSDSNVNSIRSTKSYVNLHFQFHITRADIAELIPTS